MAARHKQVGQRTGHERPRAVLGQAAVPHLGELEQALDDPEGVFRPERGCATCCDCAPFAAA
jgi:hypothetical protein